MVLHARNKRSAVDPQNQRGLSYLCGIKDVQGNPDEVSLEFIQPVVDVSFDGYAKLNDYHQLLHCIEVGKSIAGVQSQTVNILSYGNATGADQQIIVPIGYNFVSWGFKVHVTVDAAGAAALHNKWFSMELEMIHPVGNYVTKWHAGDYFVSGVQQYHPGYHYSENITREHLHVIPAGCALIFVVWIHDGSNFPANTTLHYCLMGQAVPEGAAIPYAV